MAKIKKSKEYLQTYRTESKEVINTETGEIETQTIYLQRLVGSPSEFWQLYTDVLQVIAKIKPIEATVYIMLMQKANSKTNVVPTDGITVKEIAKELNISDSAIKKAFAELKEVKLLITRGKGTSQMNPRYFWKGNSNDRRITLEYILKDVCPDC